MNRYVLYGIIAVLLAIAVCAIVFYFLNPPKIVTVGQGKDYTDLQAAIDAHQGNYIIKISPGRYIFEKALSIVKKRKITIAGEGKVDLVCSELYEDVLHIQDCRQVILKNIRAFHDPFEPGDCGGNVILLVESKNILIYNCTLNGCGMTGVEADIVEHLRVENCEIHSNTLLALKLSNARNIKIANNRIYYNFQNMELIFCRRILITGNVFEHNDDQQIRVEEVTGLKLQKNVPENIPI